VEHSPERELKLAATPGTIQPTQPNLVQVRKLDSNMEG